MFLFFDGGKTSRRNFLGEWKFWWTWILSVWSPWCGSASQVSSRILREATLPLTPAIRDWHCHSTSCSFTCPSHPYSWRKLSLPASPAKPSSWIITLAVGGEGRLITLKNGFIILHYTDSYLALNFLIFQSK